MKKGIIKSISNDIRSGLQTITFEDGNKVSIENFGVRQIASILENPIGEEITYEVDDFNLMSSFNFT